MTTALRRPFSGYYKHFKCSHCQKVHSYREECDEIKALREFCGDSEYQEKLKKKAERKQRIRN